VALFSRNENGAGGPLSNGITDGGSEETSEFGFRSASKNNEVGSDNFGLANNFIGYNSGGSSVGRVFNSGVFKGRHIFSKNFFSDSARFGGSNFVFSSKASDLLDIEQNNLITRAVHNSHSLLNGVITVDGIVNAD